MGLHVRNCAIPMAPTTSSPEWTRVLLVDDEPHVTLAIQQALRREPFEFECATSGKQALALLDRAHFDVVVSDERMPEMAGSDFLTLVRQQHPDVARIILSEIGRAHV